jgi:hypothetical protein
MSKSNASAVSFKVESGVTIPAHTSRGVYASTIASMKTGDSTVCQKMGQVLSFRSAAKAAGCSVIAHKQDNGSYRIWKSDKPTAVRAKTTRKPPTNAKGKSSK